MSFYKKAVVWLGLNEEYPDSIESTYGHAEGEGQIAVDGSANAAPKRPLGPDAAVQRGPERVRPRPTQQAALKPAAEPAKGAANPLKHDARRDRSEGTVRVIPMDEPVDSTSPNPPGSMSEEFSSSKSAQSGDPLGGTVRAVPLPATTKPVVVVPQSFNDAQSVADMYRDATPVIVNMQSAERDLARRLIDFSSGLCYGLGGQMEKVAKDVYLLTPSDVEVADEDRDKF